MNNIADVIIIGGGIHGASTAFHLAERGLKVLVIEKNTLGSAATGRSSGLVRMHYDLEPESRLAWEIVPVFSGLGSSSGRRLWLYPHWLHPDYYHRLRRTTQSKRCHAPADRHPKFVGDRR